LFGQLHQTQFETWPFQSRLVLALKLPGGIVDSIVLRLTVEKYAAGDVAIVKVLAS
jgi:hypothetical protein